MLEYWDSQVSMVDEMGFPDGCKDCPHQQSRETYGFLSFYCEVTDRCWDGQVKCDVTEEEWEPWRKAHRMGQWREVRGPMLYCALEDE